LQLQADTQTTVTSLYSVLQVYMC